MPCRAEERRSRRHGLAPGGRAARRPSLPITIDIDSTETDLVMAGYLANTTQVRTLTTTRAATEPVHARILAATR